MVYYFISKNKKEVKIVVKTGLTFYKIRVYEPDEVDGKRGTHHKFDKIPNKLSDIRGEPKELDIVAILNDIFAAGKYYIFEEKYKGVKIIEWHENNRIISGIIDAGNYGNKRRIMDKETEKDEDPLEKSKIVFDPYYFLFKFPTDSKIGCLIVETKGSGGAYGILSDWLNEELQNTKNNPNSFRCSHIKLTTVTATPVKLLERYLKEGNIGICKYIKENANEDIFDQDEVEEIKKTIILEFEGETMTPEEFFKKITGGVITYDNTEYDNVILETELDGVKKQISFKNQKKIRSNFDVSNAIHYDEDGNPIYKSIHEKAIELAEEHYNDIWM